MNTAIIKNIGNSVSKSTFKLRKHSPEILVVTGVVGTVASTVLACKATTKVNDILEDAKERIDVIHSIIEEDQVGEQKYSKKDGDKALTVAYVQTGLKLAKEYAPAVALGVMSIGCILGGHHILSKRNVALAAAYATIDQSFRKYRGNVVTRFGEAVDKELKYNLKSEKVTETVVDEETGKEKKVKKTIQVAEYASDYARFFEEYTVDKKGNNIKNPCWDKSPEYNLMFLKAQQQYANDLLISRGHVFLNEVYDMLGLPRTKAGQVVGWVYNENNPVGDNYIDFGIYSGGSQNFSDFVYGTDNAILLDFNVDGNIWGLM
jgi:hypothetical protein